MLHCKNLAHLQRFFALKDSSVIPDYLKGFDANSIPRTAPVAQPDRALPSGGRGRGFESLRARHKIKEIVEVRLCRIFRKRMVSAKSLTFGPK
jgi:hypothetical protein